MKHRSPAIAQIGRGIMLFGRVLIVANCVGGAVDFFGNDRRLCEMVVVGRHAA